MKNRETTMNNYEKERNNHETLWKIEETTMKNDEKERKNNEQWWKR